MRSDKFRPIAIIVLLLATRGAAPAQRPMSAAATVDGEAITMAEVDRTIGASVAALAERIFQLRLQRLDALIAEQLLAQESARRGMSNVEGHRMTAIGLLRIATPSRSDYAAARLAI